MLNLICFKKGKEGGFWRMFLMGGKCIGFEGIGFSKTVTKAGEDRMEGQ
ncbi:MAG: hypothetical protein JXR34_00940 [Bacteroidales bacterium]|nr:hypothetical protein [Bacteroidales bacterium]